MRRGLLPAMEGKLIEDAQIRRPDLRWPFPERMRDRLIGCRVTALRRRSKYILADLSSGETLIIHLGMSGHMLVDGAGLADLHHRRAEPAKHDHVIFDMEGGARVTFNDARRFGAMDLVETDQLEQHWLIRKLGPEPLGNAFHADYLAAQLRKKASPIKSALLDQRVVAGLGNIYVCEVLHRTGISPRRLARSISRRRVESLVPAIRSVLAEAIDSGGSSLRDHRQTDGNLGYFQHSFSVYDQAGERCSTPDCQGVITRIVQAGRSSFYCPRCQR